MSDALPESVLVPVRAQPRSSRSAIEGVCDGHVRIRTTAAPTDGKANQDIVRQLAAAYGVPPSRVTLKRGATGRSKVFIVREPRVLPAWHGALAFRSGPLGL